MKNQIKLFLAGASLLGAVAVQSATLTNTYTQTIPLTRTDWTTSLTFPKFDPALGTLLKVSYFLSGSETVTIGVENEDFAPVTVSAQVDAQIRLRRPDNSEIVVTVPSTTEVRNLASFDGATDFGGTSGFAVAGLTAGDQDSVDAVAPSPDLALFTGPSGSPGTINLPVTANALSTVTGGANLTRFTRVSASAEVRVSYIYDAVKGSVGDFVWCDKNGDGVQDSGEPGIGGVSVQLCDDSGNFIAGTTTDGSGLYLFPSLDAGNYRVKTLPPPGYAQTFDLDGTGTPNVAAFPLAQGQNRLDVDFGYQPNNGSLGDRVWYDDDGDGVQDGGEIGIVGVTVSLYDSSNNLLATDVTDGNGNYLFENLTPRTYTVRVTSLPTGIVQTYDLDGIGTADVANAPLGPNESRLDVDFGYKRINAKVGDFVWLDRNLDGVQDGTPAEPGIPGVSVRLFDSLNVQIASMNTDANGYYLFENLSAGHYSVVVDPPAGYAQTYDLDGLGTAHTAQFELGAGETKLDVDFGYVGGNLGDRVWHDLDGDGLQDSNEPGIPGVTVELLDGSNTVIGSTTTDASGFYPVFGDLPAGTYTVRVLQPVGYVQTYDIDGLLTPHRGTVVLPAGEGNLDVDFGYRQQNGSLGDRVWYDDNGDGVQDSGEAGIPGVTMTLCDAGGVVLATTVTDGNGFYNFPNLAGAVYKVCAAQPAGTVPTYDLDGIVTPNCATGILKPGEHREDFDFGYLRLASLGDYVWIDSNSNGTQESGEPAVDGVTVQLLNQSGTVVDTTVTAGGGKYLFTSLQPGVYSVRFTKPSGYEFTASDVGGNEAIDSDANLTTGETAQVTLMAGDAYLDLDAGLLGLAALGNFVWFDTNQNGIQNPGEPGIDGVTVELLNGGGSVLGTQITSGGGNYLFTGLQPGTYIVRFTAPGGTVFTLANQVGTEATDSDANPVTGATDPVTLVAGQTNLDVDAGVYRNVLDVCVFEAIGNGSGHALYLPGIGTDFVFSPNPGSFKENMDGTATFTGIARSSSNPGNGFVVSVSLTGFSTTAPSGSPKLELPGSSYVPAGPINPATWVYYTGLTGSLTGIGGYQGGVINIGRMGPAFQVGYGANGKNHNFGASGWLTVSVASNPTAGPAFNPTSNGDFNLDFSICPPPPPCLANGLKAEYFNNKTLTGSPALTRLDTTINFDWGTGSPAPGTIGADNFSVRWSGQLTVPTSGNYVFTTRSDDGVRLLVNGVKIIENWTDHAPVENSGAISLQAGITYSIVMEFYENTGGAVAQLSYQGPATGGNKVIIPAERFCTDQNATASIGDRVWDDLNANGVQDGGEPGVNGVGVELRRCDNNALVASTVTASGGLYSFSVAPGNYYVKFVNLPAGYQFSPSVANAASDPNDSDANTATGQTDCTTLVTGENDTTWDAGIFRPTVCVPGAITLSGSSGLSGTLGNIRTYAGGGVSVKVSAFSRNRTTGAWGTAFVGAYGGGLGVTDATEGDGSGNSHTTDNLGGQDNYLLFEFSEPVNLDKVSMGYVVNDSDISVWIGTANNPFVNHLNLSDALLSGFGAVESNDTTLTGPRTADVNVAGKIGNVVVVAASVLDTTPEDNFKLSALEFCRPTVSTGTAQIGDRVWNDANGNGTQDSGETGVAGVTVQLRRCSDNSVVATTVSSTTGIYGFTVAPGSYYVQFSGLPSGYVFSPSTAGAASDANDSDVNPSTGRTDCTTLDSGENDASWDAGIYLPGVTQCVPGTITFSGSSSVCGTVGNIRTFSGGGVSVKVSGFSRNRSNGAWSQAFVGIFSGGLGVTDASESGSGGTHTVDNIGQENYLMFEFSEPVILNSVSMGYVIQDSDISVWVGNASNPFNNHINLNGGVLSGLGYTEENMTSSTSTRIADVNSGNVVGNVVVIAASVTDTTPEDQFKLASLGFCRPSTTGVGTGLKGCYFPNTGCLGNPAYCRNQNVDFNWGTGGPGGGIANDNFSVIWTGFVRVPTSGNYTFFTQSDDGVKLNVNGNWVINNWTAHSSTENASAQIWLNAGEPVPIRLEYYEATGSAVIQLKWAGPGIAKTVIPVTSLYPN